MNIWFQSAILAAAAVWAAGPASADTVGSRLFADNCASCHGQDGTGTGPLAELLTVALPDLTQLKASNDGMFPFARVYNVVDGRADVAAHGGREMPVWGQVFADAAAEEYNPFPGSTDEEAFTQDRILAVITYLQTIQK